MTKRTLLIWAGGFSLCTAGAVSAPIPQAAREPLGATTLLALVAGNALPENVVAAIETDGLSFKPTEEYRSQLREAGATAEILKALDKVPAGSKDAADQSRDGQTWSHLSLAGKLIREKKYEEAEGELNEAVQTSGAKLDAGFVMAEALRLQEQWGRSVAVYAEILKEDPNYPEAQTKLSFVLYRAGEAEESLRAAKAALAITPANAEAHKNAGLALEAMRKFDAATEEFREALRIKPNYESVHYDLGILLYDKNQYDGAITEYKKALALDPNDISARMNLALAYREKNEGDSAIKELREAKKLAPKNLEVRQNLGSLLVHQELNADAVAELRELEALAPESAVCHLCLATALYRTNDYEGAKKELEIAIRLDPTDPTGYRGLGDIYEAQAKHELALKQYRMAQKIDPNSVEVRLVVARVLLETKQAALAVEELKAAKDLEPGNTQVHEEYGTALEALGKLGQAKSEYEEAIMLDGENAFALVDLAKLLEKQGDWAGAIQNYRTAANQVQTQMITSRGPRVFVDAPGEYRDAQARLKQHLSDLRAARKSEEASALEARIESMNASQGISGELDAAMEAGLEALKGKRFDEAERNYKEAVKLAEQLKPHEGRLVLSLGYLGSVYANRKDYADAQASYERSLKFAEEVYGAGAPQVGLVLEALARLNLEQGDPKRAVDYAQQELTIAEKNAGTNSLSYSFALMTLGYVYYTQKQYEYAAPYLDKAVKIHEQLSGPQAMIVVSSKQMLCQTYDGMGQPAKAEACSRELLPLVEKAFGANSTALAPLLKLDAKALRELGRGGEADEVERRMQSLQQAAVTPN